MERNISVAGVLEQNGLILVMHRLPGGAVGGLWEFPGGKVEQGEDPEEALEREWMEETGLRVSVGREITRGSFTHQGKDVQLIAFEVQLSEESVEPELREHDDWKWVAPDQIHNLPLVGSDRIVLSALS